MSSASVVSKQRLVSECVAGSSLAPGMLPAGEVEAQLDWLGRRLARAEREARLARRNARFSFCVAVAAIGLALLAYRSAEQALHLARRGPVAPLREAASSYSSFAPSPLSTPARAEAVPVIPGPALVAPAIPVPVMRVADSPSGRAHSPLRSDRSGHAAGPVPSLAPRWRSAMRHHRWGRHLAGLGRRSRHGWRSWFQPGRRRPRFTSAARRRPARYRHGRARLWRNHRWRRSLRAMIEELPGTASVALAGGGTRP